MNQSIYILCQIIVFLITFFLIAFTTYGLRRAYLAMGKDMGRQKQMIKWVFYGMICWLIIITMLSGMGFYSNFEVLPPRILIFALLPPLLLIISLLFSKEFGRILSFLPPQWLIQIQSFRVLMEVMLWLGFMGFFIPFQMTYVGFNMDIIAGITAIFAGRVFFGKNRFLLPESIIWNIFGIFLLINIVFIATISTPSPLQIFKNEPVNTFIAKPIFIWIPGFIVPFAIAMHLFSIKQVLILRKNR